VDHQDWGDWGDGDDYSGDAETADLGDPDEPLAGGYEDPGHEPGLDPGHDPDGEHGVDPGSQGGPGGGFLEDDPMGAFGTDDGSDEPGDHADPGHGDLGHDDGEAATSAEPGHEYAAGPDFGTDHAEPDASSQPHPETVVGADPDVDPDADWAPADFPDQLDFAAPEPVDGYPWSDPSAVAAPGTGGDDPATGPDSAPPAQDLLDYAGADGGADPWAALVGSDDPAASSLGRWWAPGA
jgi:hypothetical protein